MGRRRTLDALVEVFGALVMLRCSPGDGWRPVQAACGGNQAEGGISQREAVDLAAWLRERPVVRPDPQPAHTDDLDDDGPTEEVPRPGASEVPGGPTAIPQAAGVAVTDTDPDPGYDYEHRRETGEYVFTFPGKAGALVLPDWRVEAMLDDYTNWDGNSHTMDEVARSHNLTRAEFYGVKRAMGWTKTSLPLLEEQWGRLSEDEAAEHLVAKKQRGAEVKARRRVWRDIERDADRWRRFEAEKLKPFEQLVERLNRTYEPPEHVRPVEVPEGRPCAAVWMPADHHVGKPGAPFQTGMVDGGFGEAEARLLDGTRAFVSTLPPGCERIIGIVGQDFFTGDNLWGDTTRGTRQEMAGTGVEMLHRGCAMKLRAVELLVGTGLPVELLVVPGNHDMITSELMGGLLWGYFRSAPTVTVHTALRDLVEGRQVEQGSALRAIAYGTTLLASVHGDGIVKPQDLAVTLAHLYPELWGRCRHRIVAHGHFHTAKMGPLAIRVQQDDEIREEHGLLRWSMPSLSAMDAWHYRKGYCTNKPAILAPVIDREHGWVGTRRFTVGMLRAMESEAA